SWLFPKGLGTCAIVTHDRSGRERPDRVLDRLEPDTVVAREGLGVRVHVDPDLIGDAIGEGIAGRRLGTAIMPAPHANWCFADHGSPPRTRANCRTISGHWLSGRHCITLNASAKASVISLFA